MALSITGVKDFLGIDRFRKRELSGRFNLIAAAEAHILWKTRLGHHVQGNIRESLESAPLGQDGVCQLGSWINGSVLEPFCEPEVHRQLSEAHKQFHQLSVLIIERLKAGDHSDAAAIFKNEYNQSLRHIIQALTEINKHLQEE
ncbi:MAG TPA: CZB domain-containing protein [Gallionella sp.]|nr:CZB domain-containing protein [Gallionella sp.]